MNTTGITIKHYASGPVDVVAACGEVDILTIDELKHLLLSTSESANNLVVDLRETSYIDSAGLELLVSVYARRSKQKKPFAILVRQQSQPDTVLHVVYLHTLTKVTSDPGEVGLEG